MQNVQMKEWEKKSSEGTRPGNYKDGTLGRTERRAPRLNKTRPETGSSSPIATVPSFNFSEFSTNTPIKFSSALDTKETGGLSRSLGAKPAFWSFGDRDLFQNKLDGQGAPQQPSGITASCMPHSGPTVETSNNARGSDNVRDGSEKDQLKINPKTPLQLTEIQTSLNNLQIGVKNEDNKVVNEPIATGTSAAKVSKVSLVYKCHACGLCFDWPEFLLKHLNNCSPAAKIVKIHCVCGLVFDKYSFAFHCKIHRQFTTLYVKQIVVRDDGIIDVSGMVEEFIEDEMVAVESKKETDKSKTMVKSQVAKYAVEEKGMEEKTGHHQTTSTVVVKEDIHTGVAAAQKTTSALVYKCQCKLCFDRPEFLLKHLNRCSPGAKLVKIYCVCGLVFDKHNFTYHCEVHRQVAMLNVKEIVVCDDGKIEVGGMVEDFMEDDQINDATTTKIAEQETLDQNLSKRSVEKHGIERKGTDENIMQHKIVSAVISTNESDIDGEKQTMITVVIALGPEKNIESPTTTNKDDNSNKEATELQGNNTKESHEASGNATKEIDVPAKPSNGENSGLNDISESNEEMINNNEVKSNEKDTDLVKSKENETIKDILKTTDNNEGNSEKTLLTDGQR